MARLSFIYALGVSLLLSFPSSAVGAGDWVWPVRGEVIGPYRNGVDPYAGGQHRGIDIAAPVGRPVATPTGGRVTFAGTAGSSGLTVSVRTGDGRYDTSYLHLSSVSVREGEGVSRGERLGAVGTTGRRSTAAPHLHFGVREAGSRHAYRDPLSFLAPIGPGGEAPGALPAPVPAPARLRPGSAPVPAGRRVVPFSTRRPLGARSPARAPGLGPVPAALRAGTAVGRALRPAALGASATVGSPGPSPVPGRSASRLRDRPALAGPRPGPAAAPMPRAATAPLGATGRREGGFDLGYALACLGLAAAGLALGRPAATRAAASRGRAAVRRRLVPPARRSLNMRR